MASFFNSPDVRLHDPLIDVQKQTGGSYSYLKGIFRAPGILCLSAISPIRGMGVIANGGCFPPPSVLNDRPDSDFTIIPLKYPLDAVLGNVKGDFVWGLQNFTSTARNISGRVQGQTVTLLAELAVDQAQTQWKQATFDLTHRFELVNGQLSPRNGDQDTNKVSDATLELWRTEEFYRKQTILNDTDIRIGNDFIRPIANRTDGFTFLHCEVHDAMSNTWHQQDFPLDYVLGNIDGNFVWGLKGFSTSARSIRGTLNPPHVLLEAELLAADRTTWKAAKYELCLRFEVVQEQRIGTSLSIPAYLNARRVPTSVAFPKGQPAQNAADTVKKILTEDKEHKIQAHKYDAPDGTEIFYFSAGVGGNPDNDMAVKTLEPELSAAIAHVSQDTGHPLEKVDARFVELHLGASIGFSGGDDANNIPTFVGYDASFNLVNAEAGPAHVKLGIGIGSDLGIKDDSLSVHALGCGITIGRKVGISIFGSELSLDFGTFFE